MVIIYPSAEKIVGGQGEGTFLLRNVNSAVERAGSKICKVVGTWKNWRNLATLRNICNGKAQRGGI